MNSSDSGCFNGNGRCCCFFFLPEKYSEILATLVMMGICAGTHFLNIMIHEEIGTFLTKVSNIFDVTVQVSLVVFFVGLFWQKLPLLKQVTIVFAVYIFFSLSCFCCNFITLIFGDCYRETYNLFTVYHEIYINNNPNTTKEEDEIKKDIKTKFYVEVSLHIVSLCIMVYYYIVTSSYVENIEKEGDEYGRKFLENSTNTSKRITMGTNNSSNFTSNNTFNTSKSGAGVV
ncbi:hypothetical protein PIROE2DRAFT_13662 [Piromyces sp. E2]|nr:hypothetical protein PIROE2DRAFT_13662 [Piromyces sp. E2]|eukprot:OUM60546.1 hypothetical protein PIROE2DRAFT_13662 [Piromyces sp. E2]